MNNVNNWVHNSLKTTFFLNIYVYCINVYKKYLLVNKYRLPTMYHFVYLKGTKKTKKRTKFG